MRFLIGIFSAMLLMTALAFAQDEAPRCDNCGMFWEKSPTAVEMTIEVEGEEHTHLFECVGCMHDYIHENYGEAMPTSIMILDYNTVGTDEPVMLDAFKAHYLFGTERIKGSMPPFVAAFATEEAAEEAQEELGGELVDFKGMKQMMMKAKGEGEGMDHSEMGHGDMHGAHHSAGDDEAVYVCPCTGSCCTDIQSNEPGECPKCGMTLEKKG